MNSSPEQRSKSMYLQKYDYRQQACT